MLMISYGGWRAIEAHVGSLGRGNGEDAMNTLARRGGPWIAAGIAIGIAVGVVFGAGSVGLAVGLVAGLLAGIVAGSRSRR